MLQVGQLERRLDLGCQGRQIWRSDQQNTAKTDYQNCQNQTQPDHFRVGLGLKKYRMARKNADTNSDSRSERAVALMLTLMATSFRRDVSEVQHGGDDHHHRQR